ncbi:hypothetical protein SODALDRAFT_330796 [Sodiomyces alkalinus F11]|uniref:RO10 protein n=1 Tax=Sodiomyces alkalinus (strain CBS 110278 / VKM F-3762 / F11) TaxID=1314773 RepID=A0A3N2Q2T4_SODAK|nr:hypothetical protein SODALDRAFT_330796 [Sodiomyces alkalinus F11]ROT41079.1 hypothetical protein SODALDRAFT_330796 [Sodiomyces alkalinus F11]
MDVTLDNTTLSTLSLLEARLLRIEHLLYGPSAAPTFSQSSREDSAAEALESLERRFYALLGRIKVYGELMKIYKVHPTLFHPPPPDQPPIDLPAEAIRATVIASAASFPAIASSLTSVSDCPVPDPAQSAALASLAPRMRGVEATQRVQAAEMAELRARSEAVIQSWYEDGVLAASRFVADVEGRAEKVERRIRRAEREREREAADGALWEENRS